jgi:subtilisin family serine protease
MPRIARALLLLAPLVLGTACGSSSPTPPPAPPAPPPTLTNVVPGTGPAAGGTAITLTGTNFGGAPTVVFGSGVASSVVVVTDTQITCVTPAGMAGLEDVQVTTAGGTATLAASFTYTGVLTPFVANDTHFGLQWHLVNTGQGGGTPGQDAQVAGAWGTGITGSGVRIHVLDDALEIGHVDLAPNVLAGQSHDYVENDADPQPPSPVDDHGTAVAGVAAARGGNGLGVTGAAPRALLAGFNVVRAGITILDFADALARNHAVTSIYNNSWGLTPNAGPAIYADVTQFEKNAIAVGIANGRFGRGSVYVKSAGNAGEVGLNANMDGSNTVEGLIVVGAVDADGIVSCYSAPGANVLVTAPSSSCMLPPPAIATTDLLNAFRGVGGMSKIGFSGTSSAAPLVSGVVALILQANPMLEWQDVARVLATSARQTDLAHPDWTTNAAGHPVNHHYGFGVVDASAGVLLAQATAPTPLNHAALGSQVVNMAIPDNDAMGVDSTIVLGGASALTDVDYVTVVVTTTHGFATDLSITLTAPSGTVSRLAVGHAMGVPANSMPGGTAGVPGTAQFVTWRHLGEDGTGTWTLRVADVEAADVGTFNGWAIRLHGR